MWPFGHTKAFPADEREPVLSAAMKARLDELEENNRKLEKALRALELDWSEWFNKFRLLYARLTKRIRDEEKNLAQDAPGATNGERSDHSDELVHHRLTPYPNRQRKNY